MPPVRSYTRLSIFSLMLALGGCAAASPIANPNETLAPAAAPAPALKAASVAPTASASAPASPAAPPAPSAAPAPPPAKIQLAASGQAHSCALLEDKTFYCWGAGSDGQLGVGQQDSPKALEVKGLGDVQAIALGASHSCVLLASGKVNCWGKVPPSKEITPPHEIAGLDRVTRLAAGASFNCVSRANDIGKVRCWGYNKKHQLCDGSSINRAKPMAIPSLFRVENMALGTRHGCVFRKGAIECFGANGHGQVVSLLAPRPTRSVVSGLSKSTFLSAGEAHSCSANATQVSCWGNNHEGALAHKNPKERGPVSIPLDKARNNEAVLQLVSGNRHSCIRTASRVICWGSNRHGQLAAEPLQAIKLKPSSHIAAGGNFSCAISSHDGQLRCWGGNEHGQCGQPASANPTKQPSLVRF